VFRDELSGLLPQDEDAGRLAALARTLAEQLQADGWEPPKLDGRALLHGHCHQNAVIGVDADVQLLEAMGLELEGGGEYGAGCCGLAGSFGFEADKYDLSMRIGERRLLPAVRELPPGVLVVTDGFSCRTQIQHGTGRGALHIAEVAARALEGDSRRRARGRSM
jgi:Fe-S oxidoreductase